MHLSVRDRLFALCLARAGVCQAADKGWRTATTHGAHSPVRSLMDAFAASSIAGGSAKDLPTMPSPAKGARAVCMHACTYVRYTYVRVYDVCMYAGMHADMHVNAHSKTHSRMYACMFAGRASNQVVSNALMNPQCTDECAHAFSLTHTSDATPIYQRIHTVHEGVHLVGG